MKVFTYVLIAAATVMAAPLSNKLLPRDSDLVPRVGTPEFRLAAGSSPNRGWK